MQRKCSETAVQLRVIAARMRAHAAETTVDLFRRQFESTAAELEEAATDLESRETSPVPPRLVS